MSVVTLNSTGDYIDIVIFLCFFAQYGHEHMRFRPTCAHYVILTQARAGPLGIGLTYFSTTASTQIRIKQQIETNISQPL